MHMIAKKESQGIVVDIIINLDLFDEIEPRLSQSGATGTILHRTNGRDLVITNPITEVWAKIKEEEEKAKLHVVENNIPIAVSEKVNKAVKEAVKEKKEPWNKGKKKDPTIVQSKPPVVTSVIATKEINV